MSNVILIAGTIVEMQVTTGMTTTWQEVPRLTEIGAVGEQSEPKEKTTLSDRIKKYDSGMRDAPDKNLKGQYVPLQQSGDQYFNEYTLQQAFIQPCRDEEEFKFILRCRSCRPSGHNHPHFRPVLSERQGPPGSVQYVLPAVPASEHAYAG